MRRRMRPAQAEPAEIQENAAAEQRTAAPQQFTAHEQFARGIESPSTAKNAVFNLYMEGHMAEEITETLRLPINIIKTHNKRIHIKVNLSLRKNLMAYVST